MRKALIVLSGVALVLIITAGASGTVQRLITGRDIRNNSITSADIKNGTLVRGDMSRRLAASLRGPRGRQGPRGSAGARGATGAAGAKGTTGPAGASAFDTVPPGVTIRGVVGLDIDAANPAGDWGTLETLGMPASAALDDAHVAVNIAHWVDTDCGGTPCGNTMPTTTDPNAGCTGDPANPTAPAGIVCIYVLHSDNAQDLFGYGVDSRYGFKLNFTNVNPGDSFVDATWAYTG